MFPTALTVGPLQALLPTETIQIQDAPAGRGAASRPSWTAKRRKRCSVRTKATGPGF